MRPSRIVLGVILATLLAGPALSRDQSAAPPATSSAVQLMSPVKETHPPRIRVPAAVEDKNVVQRVPVMFPPSSLKKMYGTVVLHVIIAEDGTVQKVDYISGLENLAATASYAVKHWKYKRALLNGQPVEVDTTVHVVFSQPTQTPPAHPLPPPWGITSDSIAAARATPRIRVPGDVQEQNLTHRVYATYPPHAAFDLHISGTVLMHVVISRNGSVQSVAYISGPKELKDAAMDAVMKWKYNRPTLNGQPVEVDTTVDMVFSLN
jgi:TonB family protein